MNEYQIIIERKKSCPDDSSPKAGVIDNNNIFQPRNHLGMFAFQYTNEFMKPKFSNSLFWRWTDKQSHIQSRFWHRQWVWNGQGCPPKNQVLFMCVCSTYSTHQIKTMSTGLPAMTPSALQPCLYLKIALLYPVSTLFHTKYLCLSTLFFYAMVSVPWSNLHILPGMLSSLLMSLRTVSKN